MILVCALEFFKTLENAENGLFKKGIKNRS